LTLRLELILVSGHIAPSPWSLAINLVATTILSGWSAVAVSAAEHHHPLTSTKYTVSQKSCAKFFLSELRQISTNFVNFWHKDEKEAKIMYFLHDGHLPESF